MTSEGIQPVTRTLNTLMIACNTSNKFNEALAVHSRLVELGLESNTTTYNALITAHSRLGRMDLVVESFNQMVAQGCERTVITYSALITACERAGQWELALQMFGSMISDGCTPNTITYNAVLSACAHGGQWEQAMDLFYQMQHQGCQPDVVSYTSLISACDKGGQWRKAAQAFEHLRASGCRPDAIVFSTLIEALWGTGVDLARDHAVSIYRLGCAGGFITSLPLTSNPPSPPGPLPPPLPPAQSIRAGESHLQSSLVEGFSLLRVSERTDEGGEDSSRNSSAAAHSPPDEKMTLGRQDSASPPPALAPPSLPLDHSTLEGLESSQPVTCCTLEVTLSTHLTSVATIALLTWFAGLQDLYCSQGEASQDQASSLDRSRAAQSQASKPTMIKMRFGRATLVSPGDPSPPPHTPNPNPNPNSPGAPSPLSPSPRNVILTLLSALESPFKASDADEDHTSTRRPPPSVAESSSPSPSPSPSPPSLPQPQPQPQPSAAQVGVLAVEAAWDDFAAWISSHAEAQSLISRHAWRSDQSSGQGLHPSSSPPSAASHPTLRPSSWPPQQPHPQGALPLMGALPSWPPQQPHPQGALPLMGGGALPLMGGGWPGGYGLDPLSSSEAFESSLDLWCMDALSSAMRFEQTHHLDIICMGPSYLSLRAQCVVKVALDAANVLGLPEEVSQLL